MNIPIRQLKKAYSRSSFVPKSYHIRTSSQTNSNNRSFFFKSTYTKYYSTYKKKY